MSHPLLIAHLLQGKFLNNASRRTFSTRFSPSDFHKSFRIEGHTLSKLSDIKHATVTKLIIQGKLYKITHRSSLQRPTVYYIYYIILAF